MATQGYLRPPREVLSQVVDKNTGPRLGDLDRLKCLRHPDWRKDVTRQPAARTGDLKSSSPLRVVKSRRVPAVQLFARIVVFSAISRRESNWAAGTLPFRIA